MEDKFYGPDISVPDEQKVAAEPNSQQQPVPEEVRSKPLALRSLFNEASGVFSMGLAGDDVLGSGFAMSTPYESIEVAIAELKSCLAHAEDTRVKIIAKTSYDRGVAYAMKLMASTPQSN